QAAIVEEARGVQLGPVGQDAGVGEGQRRRAQHRQRGERGQAERPRAEEEVCGAALAAGAPPGPLCDPGGGPRRPFRGGDSHWKGPYLEMAVFTAATNASAACAEVALPACTDSAALISSERSVLWP